MHAATGPSGPRGVLADGDGRPPGGMADYLAGRAGTGGAGRSALEFVADCPKRNVVRVGDFAETPGTDGQCRIALDGRSAMLAGARPS